MSPTALQIHLKEVNQYPILTTKEEKELALRAMIGNKEARDKLITSNMRYVIGKALEYKNQGAPLEDLIQEGYLGLCKAVDRYDPLKGYKFITFASWWIWQSILQFLTIHANTIRIPANKLGELRELKKAEEKLHNELGRRPTLTELEEELPEINVQILLPWINNKSQYNKDDDGNYSEDEEISELSAASRVPFPSPDEEIMTKSFLEKLDKVINQLPEREGKIIRLYYGMNDMKPLTLEEIGGLVGLTRERIRQIKNIALEKLANTEALKEAL